MEYPGNYLLKCSEFQINFENAIKETQKNTHSVNVTLACADNQRIEAHKVILSAASSLFMELLTTCNQEHPIIFFEGMHIGDLARVVNFIYQGKVKIQKEDLNIFLGLAEQLKLKGFVNVKELPKLDNNDIIQKMKNNQYEFNDVVQSTSNIQEIFVPLVKKMKPNNSKINADIPPVTKVKDEIFIETTYFDPLISKDTIKFKYTKVEKGVQCGYCDRQFTDKSNLHRHQKNKHEGTRYKCDHCEKVYRDQGNMSRHFKSFHAGVRFFCDICDYSARHKENVKKHKEKTHTVDIPVPIERHEHIPETDTMYTRESNEHAKQMYPTDSQDNCA